MAADLSWVGYVLAALFAAFTGFNDAGALVGGRPAGGRAPPGHRSAPPRSAWRWATAPILLGTAVAATLGERLIAFDPLTGRATLADDRRGRGGDPGDRHAGRPRPADQSHAGADRWDRRGRGRRTGTGRLDGRRAGAVGGRGRTGHRRTDRARPDQADGRAAHSRGLGPAVAPLARGSAGRDLPGVRGQRRPEDARRLRGGARRRPGRVRPVPAGGADHHRMLPGRRPARATPAGGGTGRRPDRRPRGRRGGQRTVRRRRGARHGGARRAGEHDPSRCPARWSAPDCPKERGRCDGVG